MNPQWCSCHILYGLRTGSVRRGIEADLLTDFSHELTHVVQGCAPVASMGRRYHGNGHGGPNEPYFQEPVEVEANAVAAACRAFHQGWGLSFDAVAENVQRRGTPWEYYSAIDGSLRYKANNPAAGRCARKFRWFFEHYRAAFDKTFKGGPDEASDWARETLGHASSIRAE